MSGMKRPIEIVQKPNPSYAPAPKKAKEEEEEVTKMEEMKTELCTCPKCPALKGGKCRIEFIELDILVLAAMPPHLKFRKIKCPCTAKSCNHEFPDCCEVRKPDPNDSDQEEGINSCGDCMSGGCHRTCLCCGESGNDGPHDEEGDEDEDEDEAENEAENEDEAENATEND